MNDNNFMSMIAEKVSNLSKNTHNSTHSYQNCSPLHNPGMDKKEQKDIDYPVVAEIPITGGQLHSIASGNYCLIGQKGESFAVRFMLKNSFKVPKNNFVVRNIVMQVVAVGKDNVLRREDMGTDVKIIKTKSESKKKKVNEEIKFSVDDNQKELF